MSEDAQSISEESEALTQANSESTSTLSKQRSRTSWIWQHMDGGPNTVLKVDDSVYWRCAHCLIKYKYTGGTRTMASHLEKRHGKKDLKIAGKEIVGQRIELAFARSLLNPYKRRKVFTNGSDTFDPRIFEELLIEWVATLVLELSLVTQKIHLSIDLWTGGGVAYIGVIAHYFDQYNQQKAPVLIFRELVGQHTGENQAAYVMGAVTEFGITHKLGYFMLDNASNNDTLMKHLEEDLLTNHQIKYNGKNHRLRCMGHIINLTVQAFLFGDDEYNVSPNPTALELAKWRTKGALGKLHNIVVFVQRSPQRIAEFSEYSQGKRLERDNSTQYEDELRADILNANEWSHIEGVYEILKILEQTTLDVEGSFGTLGKVIMTMDFLLKLFEDIRQSQTKEYSEAIKDMCNNAWNKLNKYYNLTETSIAYVAAIVLDPRVKWVYFTRQWPDWIDQAKKDMSVHWKAYYCGSHTGFDALQEPQMVYKDGQSEVSKFREQNNPQDDEVLDEYELYCITPRLPQKSKQRPIDWWKEESQQEAYPNLSRWAIDVLSIPAMSDEPERLFSRAANTLNEDRVQLLLETVQALECIKSWTLQKIGNEGVEHVSKQLDEEVT
ncbi:hypothetical protein V493_07869 [Pseudogymnoascus sp. VKM F-4281 (FW-2241)]|nr:hypothetical protein V493_07869 [Pseudogymnoascus sp. VKM F-4281 (FW-2241)]